MITDLVNSAAALAVSQIGKEKNKAILVSGAGVSDLTGKACTATTIHWTYDTAAIAKATTSALVGAGLKSWYFLTADYAFGTAMQRDATRFIEGAGGTVVGSIRHPLSPSDFSSFLLSAQSSKAQVIALANAGGDTANSVKQAAEFGIGKSGQRLAGLLVTLTDVHSMGLDKGQGLVVTTPFYWDRDEKTRAFTAAFVKRTGGKYPTMMHAGVYGSVLHYLKAVEAAKTDAGAAVVAMMKELPTDDPLFGKGSIRKDGRKMHPMYVYQVKKPEESRGPWDLYKLLNTVPAEQAFRPLAEGDCPLAK
jgi:branched-chain amino acid transport system substrate-binding protein